MYNFIFPDVGEGIQEGEIVKWRVKVGDEVKEDQPLVEMETAKAIVELPSPKSGTVKKLFGKEGDTVAVGSVLVSIEEKNGKADKQELPTTAPGVIGRIPTEETGFVLPPRSPEKTLTKKPTATQNVQSADHIFHGPVERVPLKGVRRAIAEHMVKSVSTIPHVIHFDEFDATNLVKLRESKKAEALKKGVKLTFLPFIIQALAETLKDHPYVNATVTDKKTADGHHEIVLMKYYNIGIAVDTPEGLMVPVIKDADKKDVFELAREIADLAQKCRDRKVDIHELSGGSFTLTNIGSVGGIYATPIITYGQAGNLGLYRMKDRPVVVDGKIEIRPIMTLTLSYDHRIVDGAQAARFMNDLIAKLIR